MYRQLDKQLADAKKRMRREFNRLGQMGFDELNVVHTRQVTQEMYDRMLADNERMYLSVGRKAYKAARKAAGAGGDETTIDADWIAGVLAGYCLVTGYIYGKEAERKRMRLNEQILTAREFDNRDAYNQSLRMAANYWWTQTSQYGIEVVDAAARQAYADAGVKKVRWVATQDEKLCHECDERDGQIYDIDKVPAKTHYNCRCHLVPVVEDK